MGKLIRIKTKKKKDQQDDPADLMQVLRAAKKAGKKK